MTYPIVIDVETQHSFQEVNYDFSKLKVSLVGSFDFATDKYIAFRENELNKLFKLMEHASQIIGYNIKKFDLPVLAPYYVGQFDQFATLDLLELIEVNLGHRVALDELARATLGVKKSGHGFMAINYFREGKWKELENYCLDDVKITRELYDYLNKHGKLRILTARGEKDIFIDTKNIGKKAGSISLSLPI